ncbi:MAG: Spo0E family sporulation regulatory protein-aspartic acid phosphatase [Firmicutes bacterium]|nr:Spo0E family sporulation regulatory protein-aspartic acid phosphatase [Bacillota bacterium]
MMQDLERRLQTLRIAIEDLRGELHSTIAQHQGKLDNAETYDISERLDKLVAEYLRLKEKLNNAYEPEYYVKLKPNPIKKEEAK